MPPPFAFPVRARGPLASVSDTANKRRCLRQLDTAASLSDISRGSDLLSCLLPLLQPVRQCLHPLFSSADAARLMRASRSITAALLADYAFVDHVFTYNNHT